MEHAFENRGSLSAGSLPGRDRAYLLHVEEGLSKRSPRPRFDGQNAQSRTTLEGPDAGRRKWEAAAIAPVIAVSDSRFADRAHGLVAGLESLPRAA
jgi:hypothetical protein